VWLYYIFSIEIVQSQNHFLKMFCGPDCDFCKDLPPKEATIPEPMPDDTPETKFFIDNPREFKYLPFLAGWYNTAQELELSCLPWKDLINNPVTIPLPCFVSYSPKHESDHLPCGELWGVLMEFKVNGFKTRPCADGTVFVCGNQSQPPPNIYALQDLWMWALNPRNCPSSMRFRSLGLALRTVCGSESAPFHVQSERKDGYYQGLKCWKVCEWNMSLDQLVKQDIPFFDYSDPLPKEIIPVLPKKTRRKRKRTVEKKVEQFMLNYLSDSSFEDAFSPLQ
jgi:hypothetical protein